MRVARRLFRTQTEIAVIWVEEFFFLRKAVAVRINGTSDGFRLRYRQRYLDLIAMKSPRSGLRKRVRGIIRNRRFFVLPAAISKSNADYLPFPGVLRAALVTAPTTRWTLIASAKCAELYLKR